MNKKIILASLLLVSFVSCSETKVNEAQKTYVMESQPQQTQKSAEEGVTYFAFNSSKLCLKNNEPTLGSAIADIKKLGSDLVEIKVVGHADERGSDEYNMTLSEKRAEAVAKYIEKETGKAVAIDYKGKREPQVVNAQTEVEHAKNRRVVITVTFLQK